MECPHCQAEFEDETTDCPECGESLKTAEDSKEKSQGVTVLKETKQRTPEGLTKEDLLLGLRSQAAGTPADKPLPSENWEDYTSSLMEVLINKHLVFPAEIDRELESEKKDK